MRILIRAVKLSRSGCAPGKGGCSREKLHSRSGLSILNKCGSKLRRDGNRHRKNGSKLKSAEVIAGRRLKSVEVTAGRRFKSAEVTAGRRFKSAEVIAGKRLESVAESAEGRFEDSDRAVKSPGRRFDLVEVAMTNPVVSVVAVTAVADQVVPDAAVVAAVVQEGAVVKR